MAPRISMIGPEITAARTQRMFSRNSLRAAMRNFPISNSSIPKALTTRFPLTVSCRIWLKSAKRVWLFSEVRRIFLPNLFTGSTTSGRRTAAPIAIFQFK